MAHMNHSQPHDQCDIFWGDSPAWSGSHQAVQNSNSYITGFTKIVCPGLTSMILVSPVVCSVYAE